jgi:hypothetical protein
MALSLASTTTPMNGPFGTAGGVTSKSFTWDVHWLKGACRMMLADCILERGAEAHGRRRTDRTHGRRRWMGSRAQTDRQTD